ncbi:uncharacterized protein LOC113359182 [Papaver somniferum]|uniref:uncharacterized protein LOC113359182 n=1 Tax=Papaver somniferum TaxID=3469 RepID=UPI000E6FB0BD|nr:uncharacterized protein LOC113359182 [Papaver somniferum]
MATLQKFKFLATQCAVSRGSPSPSRSPAASPVFQLRRRRTLRMLFSKKFSTTTYSSNVSRTDLQRLINNRDSPPEKNDNKSSISSGSNKLKDLFISSPSPPPPTHEGKSLRENVARDSREDLMVVQSSNGVGLSSSRSILSTFRYRLIKRSWRPVLITIAE